MVAQIYAKKFFYDMYDAADVPGMFGVPHAAYILMTFITVAIAIYFSRNISDRAYKRISLSIAVSITLMEAIKIALRIYKGEGYDSWIPFYFCGLFIFALWCSRCKSSVLKNLGYSYITTGGILGGAFFIFYPSTALMLYPLWHPSTIHASIYHGAMIYFGIITLMKKRYTPKVNHSLHYFGFVSFFCIISLLLNKHLGTNCMFLDNPFGLPLLNELCTYYYPIYVIVAWLGQAVAIYWLCYAVLKIITRIQKRSIRTDAHNSFT